jgi:preprotein translocase subunit SecD
VFYYRALGILTIVGLSVFGAYLIGALILLGQVNGTTLTLAGVTGIVVSIGITADSYIVYFERIKEEFQHGRGLRAAISHGFDSAFSTNLKGDTVTLLAAALLSTSLRSARSRDSHSRLGIATVIDIFVDVLLHTSRRRICSDAGRSVMAGLSIRGAMGKRRHRQGRRPRRGLIVSILTRMYRGETTFDFVAASRRILVVSAALIVASMLLILIRPFNLSIDFTGGVIVTVENVNGATVEEIRADLRSVGYATARVQITGDGIINVQTEALDPDEQDALASAVARAAGTDASQVNVRPSVPPSEPR